MYRIILYFAWHINLNTLANHWSKIKNSEVYLILTISKYKFLRILVLKILIKIINYETNRKILAYGLILKKDKIIRNNNIL